MTPLKPKEQFGKNSFYNTLKTSNSKKMECAEFVQYIKELDVRLWCEGTNLHCSAPEGVLTPALKQGLAEQKSEILSLLNSTISENTAETDKIAPAPRDFPMELSHNQKRILSLSERLTSTGTYHMAMAFRLNGPIDVSAMEKSLDEIQRRHDILRTTYESKAGAYRAEIAENIEIAFSFSDLSSVGGESRGAEVSEMVRNSVQKSFDLSTGPLWRTDLIKVDMDEHILLFTMHHIAFDGWSKNILRQEFESIYRSFVTGEAIDLPVLPIQYSDYAHWHNRWLVGAEAEKQLDFWKQQLSGAVSELNLPANRSRPAIPTFRADNQAFLLSDTLAKSLYQVSREEHVSLYIILLAAYNILLHQYTGQGNLLLCSPVHCRNKAELENLIGCFNNVVVMRTDLSGDPSLKKVIEQVKDATHAASMRQDAPVQSVSNFPGLVRIPLTRGMFSFKNASRQSLTLPGVDVESIQVRKQIADFDLAMYMEQGPENLSGILEYNTDLFDSNSVSEFLHSFQLILETIISHPNIHISELPMLGQRIENVETALREITQVDDAVIVSRGDKPQWRTMVAYILPNQYDIPDLQYLRDYLKKRFPDHLVPAIFIPIDVLPLDSYGEVDRSALSLMDTRFATSDYLAPRTPLEEKLVKIWSQILWLDQEIGIRDNFFDMGGHSLLSVQLFSEVEKYLGRKLSPSILLKLSTVEEMAGTLEAEERALAEGTIAEQCEQLSQRSEALLKESQLSLDVYRGLLAHTTGWQGTDNRISDDSLIIGVNRKGTKQPIFWCCQGFRELTQLARYLGSEQPIFGMRSGHRVMERTEDNENALASYYVAEILLIQPDGPYLIGGNCQAGRIAFKIAQLLIATGHHITLLCIQERFIPEHYPGRIALFFGNDSSRNPSHYFNQPQSTWKKFYTGNLSVHFIPGKHGEFFKEPNIQILVEKLSEEIELAKLEPQIPMNKGMKEKDQLLPASAVRAELTAPHSMTIAPGQTVRIHMTVKNISDQTWPGGPESSLTLGYKCWDGEGRSVIMTEPGVVLPADLEPGGSTTLDILFTAPLKKGFYRLELDMLENCMRWFKDGGSQTAQIIIMVRWKVKFLNRIWDLLRKIKRLLTRQL